MNLRFDDTDDDVSLEDRPSGRSDPARELDRAPADHEFTLNTGVVLVLFFALALLCAVFFGFGYSIGHKSAPPAPAPVAGDNAVPIGAPVAASTGSTKPSPGTIAVPDYVPPAGSASTHPQAIAPLPRPPAAPDEAATAGKPAPVVRTASPATEAPAVPAVSPSGTMYVQVAAVSHQEDADILLSALRRRGYTVQTRTDPNDHLIHVQLGPFATKKDADTMRQKLQGDGYNAILK